MVDRLFVYGTLAPGKPNGHILAGVPGTWAPATVHGKLVYGGWGAELGYPGIVPSQAGEFDEVVTGSVFSSSELQAHWHRLDEFEGSDYARVPIQATLEDGQVVSAQTYALKIKGTAIRAAV